MNWRSKLTSRKFWAAVANFVTMLIFAFKGTEETAAQISALIMAGAGVVAYVIGEGLADAAGASANATVMHVADWDLPEDDSIDGEKDVGKV